MLVPKLSASRSMVSRLSFLGYSAAMRQYPGVKMMNGMAKAMRTGPSLNSASGMVSSVAASIISRSLCSLASVCRRVPT